MSEEKSPPHLQISVKPTHIVSHDQNYINQAIYSYQEGRDNDIVNIIIRVFCPRAGPTLQEKEPRLQFCWRQVFHRRLRNQCCSFTRDLIGVIASRCFPHPTLSLASEQTLKDLKRSQGHQLGDERLTGPSGLHWNSPQGLNISSIRVFDQIRDPEIPITLRPLQSP